MTVSRIIQQVRQKQAAHPDRPLVIMVAGGSATGKSVYVLPQLTAAFKEQAIVIEQDWYQLGLDFAERDNSPYRWDDPRNFQLKRLADDIWQLQSGQAIHTPAFDVDAIRSLGEHHIQPHPVIIVDGLYSLMEPVADLADFSIYLEAPLYGRFMRRLFRFLYDHRQHKPQTAFKQVLGSVLKAHHDFVRPQADRADCIIRIPYSFTETIERYQLQPLAITLPANATTIWEQAGLTFSLAPIGHNAEFYISYHHRVYYHFMVEKKYLPLLENVDFASL